jgi:F-type H+-transporting ATPase subunit b
MLEIPPDFTTLLLQVALFVGLWLILSRLWFGPALRVLHERAARSEGAVREARAIQAEAERLRAEHAAALDEVRTEAQREMQEIVRSAEAEQKRLIGEARDEAQQTLGEVRARIGEEVASARRDLREQAKTIAREVAQKVLGRPV